MKKNYIIIILLFAFSYHGFSQFEIKGFGGINAASFSDLEAGLSQNSNISYQVGASVLFGTTWYVEPGIVWGVKNVDFVDSSTDAGFNNKISGMKIPVLVGYRFFGRSENLLNLRVFVGATANFNTSYKKEDIAVNDSTFNSLSWNGNVGVGVDILFLFLDAGYEIGLSDFFDTSELSSKINGFYANIGFRFMFGNSSRGRSKK